MYTQKQMTLPVELYYEVYYEAYHEALDPMFGWGENFRESLSNWACNHIQES